MRSTQTCPKCSQRKFIVSNKFRQRVHKSTATEPFWAVMITQKISDAFFAVGEPLGRFETWICLACGYTEFYARGLPRNIEAIAQAHPDDLRVVDAEPGKQGPYR